MLRHIDDEHDREPHGDNLNLNLDHGSRVDGDRANKHDADRAGADDDTDDRHQHHERRYDDDHHHQHDNRARRAAQAADELVADPRLQAAVECQDQAPPLVEQADPSFVKAQTPRDVAEEQDQQAPFVRRREGGRDHAGDAADAAARAT